MNLPDINYENLFNAVRSENELLRMHIVRLKNDGYSLKDAIVEKWEACADVPLFGIYCLMTVSLLFHIFGVLRSKNEE